MDLDELVQHWTLLDDERELAAGKRGPTRLGFALLLKFYAGAGRFPRGRSELADDAVEFVARQPGVPASDLGFYEWSGHTSEYHRAQVRRHFWFRECSAEDGGKLTEWLAASVCQAERRADRVRGELLTRCRAERIEPPSAGRCDRIIRSALHQAEQALTLRVTARLGPDASAARGPAAAAGNDEADNGEPQALSLIKSVPGNVSLESMLTEIAKLDAVRAAGLPDAAKASSQRPQATLVTQPKIAAPCEDGPGDTAERPFGFGRDGQPADPGVAPDRRECARSPRTSPSLSVMREQKDGRSGQPHPLAL